MICPACRKDYRDVPNNEIPGYFYRGDDHYYKEYRRFGIACTNCGFVAEFITKATGLPYHKRPHRDSSTIDMFPDHSTQMDSINL
jgi:hypothetical protein